MHQPFITFLKVALAFVLIGIPLAGFCGGNTFLVNSVNDLVDASIDGVCDTGNLIAGQPECTLRAAIQEANATIDRDSVHFSIIEGCVNDICIINIITDPDMGGSIPDIRNPITIDGSTQPGNAAVCTTDIPDRPAYRVVLHGDVSGPDDKTADIGLRLELGSDGSVIRGLNMRNFFNAIAVVRSDNNTLECNFLGSDETGTTAGPGNLQNGIIFGCDSNSNIIGGVTAAAGNLLSANGVNGVQFFAGFDCTPTAGNVPSNNSVVGNFIGTQKDGVSPLGNSFDGVAFFGGSGPDNNFVGVLPNGSTINGNVISGNDASGIFIDTLEGLTETTDNIVIMGNYIGTDRTGTINIGNTFGGVDIFSGTNTLIGGDFAAAANKIAFNDTGVFIGEALALGNRIQGNSIYQNTGIGIDLIISGEDPDGQNPNDPDDTDTGSNNLQNFPEITAAVQDAGMISIDYAVPTTSLPLSIEFFTTDVDNEEGQVSLGRDDYVATGTATAAFADDLLFVDDNIVATATDTNGNTSEFSTSLSIDFIDLEFRDGFE